MAQETLDDTLELCNTVFCRVVDNESRSNWLVAWDRLRPWLATKGYSLYYHDGFDWYPQHYVETEPDLYFAEMGGDSIGGRPLRTVFAGRVGFAQDASFRHYALKLIETESEEHKILLFLHENKEEVMLNNVLPVLNFLEIGKYTFAIMPRWGVQPHKPWFSTVKEAGRFIQDILKAFTFLHKHHIVYQDIKLANILTSHFATVDNEIVYNYVRMGLKNRNRIRYALCDFDSSFLLSPPPSGQSIRLHSDLSFDIGFQTKPYDAFQGELDYDPFIFDIGLLGIIFWELFSSNVQNFPLIVPLVDKMITGRLKERFSAAEALKFVEDHILGGPAELLNQPLKPWENGRITAWDPDHHDKWADLPADFVAKWGAYKAPKSSYRDLILRMICMKVYKGYVVIRFFRSLYKKYQRLRGGPDDDDDRHITLPMSGNGHVSRQT